MCWPRGRDWTRSLEVAPGLNAQARRVRPRVGKSPEQQRSALSTDSARAVKNGTQKHGALVPPGGRARIRRGSGRGGPLPTVPPSFHIFKASITSGPGLSLELQIRVFSCRLGGQFT